MPKYVFSNNVEISDDNTTGIFALFKSVLFALVFSVLILLVFSAILTLTNIPENAIPVIVILATLSGAMKAGLLASKKHKSKGLIKGIAAGAMFMLVLVIISIAYSSGESASLKMLFMFLVGTLAGGIGGVIGVNMKKKGRRKITRTSKA